MWMKRSEEISNNYSNLYISVFILWLHYVSKVSCQDSPCPDIFSYVYDDDNSIIGKVTITNPAYGENKLLVNLLLKLRGTASSFGKIDLTKGYEAENIITQGGSLLYKIKFPIQDPLPSVVSINFRGQTLCTGNPDRSVSAGESLSKIQLQHSLKVNPSSDVYYSQPVYNNQPQQYEQPQQVYRPTTSAPIQYDYDRQQEEYNYQQYQSLATTTQRPQLPPRSKAPVWIPPPDDVPINDDNSVECGVSSMQTVGLIVKGESTRHEEWPWIVAIFQKDKGKVEYICSGSIISPTLTVSAAHCAHDPVKKKNINPDRYFMKFGIHNIHDWASDEGKTRNVKSILYPPQYKEKEITYVDVAVLVMSGPVHYTEFIRPICLWTGANVHSNVNGTVVGWGRDEVGNNATPEPRLARVPVVSNDVCYNSNRQFRTLLSEHSFCAGNRDCYGPCNADSGGGLYVFRNGHFELKGIVSHSLRNQESSICNLNEYVMYADAAKFASWFRLLVEDYKN